jgi:hypothetical protein
LIPIYPSGIILVKIKCGCFHDLKMGRDVENHSWAYINNHLTMDGITLKGVSHEKIQGGIL